MSEKKKRSKQGKAERKVDGRMMREEVKQGRDKEGKRKNSGRTKKE